MAELLYQAIGKVNGLQGNTALDKQRNLYNTLGFSNQYGNYTGAYNQNVNLLKAIQGNNYYAAGLPGQQPAQSAVQPTSQSGPLSAQQIISQYTPNNQVQANPVTQFNQTGLAGAINGFDTNAYATRQITPFEDLNQSQQLGRYDRSASARGGTGFASYGSGRTGLINELMQGRNARIANLSNSIRDSLGQVYKMAEDKYYKDPNLDTMSLIQPFDKQKLAQYGIAL